MNILDKIILHKEQEVALSKERVPTSTLEKSPFFDRKVFSFSEALKSDSFGVISEFKRQSPSKGIINDRVKPEIIVKGYIENGATAVSILTDKNFFGGSIEDVKAVRPLVNAPILRKDFIIDEYQLLEAKAIGADVILLIAANLAPQRLTELAAFARSIGLEVLMEVHNLEELETCTNEYLNVIGVNNRNLKTFKVDLETSVKLSNLIPEEFVKISESGIRSADDILMLQKHGFEGFLIGESFMKTENPVAEIASFIDGLKEKTS